MYDRNGSVILDIVTAIADRDPRPRSRGRCRGKAFPVAPTEKTIAIGMRNRPGISLVDERNTITVADHRISVTRFNTIGNTM